MIAERNLLYFNTTATVLIAMSRQRSKKARLRRLRTDRAGADQELQRQCPQTSRPNAEKSLTSRVVSAPSCSLLFNAVCHLDWVGLLQTLVDTVSGLLDVLGPAPGARGRDTLMSLATQRPVVAAAAKRSDGEGLSTWHTLNGHMEGIAHLWVENCTTELMLALITTVQHVCCYASETYNTSKEHIGLIFFSRICRCKLSMTLQGVLHVTRTTAAYFCVYQVCVALPSVDASCICSHSAA